MKILISKFYVDYELALSFMKKFSNKIPTHISINSEIFYSSQLIEKNGISTKSYSTEIIIQKREQVEFIEANELIWFLEHENFYTIGTNGSTDDVTNSQIPVYLTSRGGKVSYHGHGQLVSYLMLNLRKRKINFSDYLSLLHEWIIESLKIIGIDSYKKENEIGVWTESEDIQKKIAFIGLRISKGITSHGVAVNVEPDLNFFKNIKQCGLDNEFITSIKALGVECSVEDFQKIMINLIEKFF